MNKSSYCALWLGALLASSATLATQAHAQNCASDTDCSAGFECKTTSYQSCSGGIECTPEGCVEVDSQCETVEYSYCANATCETDADCPSTMGCQAQTTYECDGGSAGTGAGGDSGGVGGSAGIGGTGGAGGTGGTAGTDDPCADGSCMPVCHEVPADSICIPRYQMPCETASDCGGGFDCVESFGWVCMGGGAGGAEAGGSGGTSGAAGAAGMSDPGVGGAGGTDACEPVSNGFNTCELQVLPCEANAECPEGLECLEHYEYPPCTYEGDGGGAGGTAGTGAAGTGAAGTGMGGDGEVGGTGGGYICPDPVVELRCMPPSYEGGGMGGIGGVGGVGGDTGGMGAGTGDNGSAGTGGTGGAAGMGSPGSGAGTGASDEDGEADEGRGHHGHHRGRGHLLGRLLHGCSTSGPVSGGSSGSWLMLGLAALVLRRRARRA